MSSPRFVAVLLLPGTALAAGDGLGYDDSERFGDVMFFSLYLYIYGAN